MKSVIKLNSYPSNYEEETLPVVIVEIRYKSGSYNKTRTEILAHEIEDFLKDK